MDTDIAPASPAEAEWVAAQRRWAHGWRMRVLHAIPLAYLLYVVGAVHTYSRGAAAIAGYAILAAFAACWLLAPLLLSTPGAQFTLGRPAPSWRFWIFYAILVALFVAELPFGRAPAFVMAVFITVATVVRLRSRATPVVAVLALAALLVPVAIPSWHESIGSSFGTVTPVAIPIVALVTFFFLQVVEGNRALTEARAELARLAAENERIRIARDLHDLLGHSLTSITVKAGLAGRLGPADPLPTSAPPSPTIATSRSPVNSPPGGNCCGPLVSPPTCPGLSTLSTQLTRNCSAGPCGKGSPTSSGTRTPVPAPSGSPRPA